MSIPTTDLTAPGRPRQRWGRVAGTLSVTWRSLVRRFDALGLSDEAVLVLLALPVGAATAVGVLLFSRGINLAHLVLLTLPTQVLPPLGLLALRPLLIAVAFTVAAAVMRVLGRDHDGMNVPDVQRAVASRGGRLPFRPAAARTAASAITIGGGGSAGSEGPLVVLGAGIGSWLAQALRRDASVTRVLVGCGSAAAISAAFNAPLAGAFFALEEILGAFSGASFTPVVVASVTAAVVSRGLFGNAPAFPIPTELGSPDSLQMWVLLPLLGVLCALTSSLFVRTYFAAEDVARRGPIPRRLLPVVGGLLVGLLLFATNGALAGDSHRAAPLSLFGQLPWWTLAALAAGKILATSLTLNFGGSGGVFTPALFIGAAAGGAFGSAAAALLPTHGIDPALYSVAGMGALVAGATGAPITGILLVFEMTNDFTLVLPLMVAVVSCKTLFRRLERDSLYSGWLRRRGVGVLIPSADVSDRFQGMTVADLLDPGPATIRHSTTVAQAIALLGRQPQSLLPVIDAEGRYLGVVSPTALGHAMRAAPQLSTTRLASDFIAPLEPIPRTATLAEATERFGGEANESLPVVTPDDGRLRGLLSRSQLLERYEAMSDPAADPEA